MASGNTITGSLADSLDEVTDEARLVRDYKGVFMRVTETRKLRPNTGLSWDENAIATMSAQRVTETTVLDNPQQYADTTFSVTPQVIGIQTIVTDRTMRRIAKVVVGKLGSTAQNAIQRLKDQDYLTVLDGATTSFAGAGTTLTLGHVTAAAAQSSYGRGVEPTDQVLYCTLHSYQLKDLQDEILAGVGTYTIPSGLTEDVFKRGFMGSIPLVGVNFFVDNNITIDSADDAKGGLHPREAIVLVQGHDVRTETRRRPEIGGGADEMFMYDEYEYGERSAGSWLMEIYSDAVAPTS